MTCLLSYTGTENLGDAIQTIALFRMLGSPAGCRFRDRDTGAGASIDDRHLINGYLDGRWRPQIASGTWFAGVYVASAEIAARVALIANGREVGARDPHSARLLKAAGARVRLIGCATLTLPRYDGPRSGTIHVDDGHPHQITQRLPKDSPWQAQWWRATERLLLLERAELVHTRRLHIALPCLAMGTPVQMPENTRATVSDPGRLSILEELGFEYGRPQCFDVTRWAEEYRTFVLNAGSEGAF